MLINAFSDCVRISLADVLSDDELMWVFVEDKAAGCAFFHLVCVMYPSARLLGDDELVIDTLSPVAFVLATKCLFKSLGLEVSLDYDKVSSLESSTKPECEPSRKRGGNYDFLKRGIPVGAELNMIGHPEITARVVDGRRVTSDETGVGYLTRVNRELCLRHGLDVTRRNVFTKWEWQGTPLVQVSITDDEGVETEAKDTWGTFDVSGVGADVVDGAGSSVDVDDSLPPVVDPFSW